MNAANIIALVLQICGYLKTAAAAVPAVAEAAVSICAKASAFIAKYEPMMASVPFLSKLAPFVADLKVALDLVATHGTEVANDIEHVLGLLTSLDTSKLTPAPPAAGRLETKNHTGVEQSGSSRGP